MLQSYAWRDTSGETKSFYGHVVNVVRRIFSMVPLIHQERYNMPKFLERRI